MNIHNRLYRQKSFGKTMANKKKNEDIKRTNSVCNRSLKRCLVKRSEISGKGELDYKYMW